MRRSHSSETEWKLHENVQKFHLHDIKLRAGLTVLNKDQKNVQKHTENTMNANCATLYAWSQYCNQGQQLLEPLEHHSNNDWMSE